VLERGPRSATPEGEAAALDLVLAELAEAASADRRVEDTLRGELTSLLRWQPLEEFTRAYAVVGRQELLDLIVKLAATSVGRSVGDSILLERSDVQNHRIIAGV
jgi:hypothetical protein